MDLISYLITFIVFVFLLAICITVFTFFRTMPNILRYYDEKYFLDISVSRTTKNLFPSLHDDYSKEISVIVPAYNEEKRLPAMMEDCLSILETKSGNTPGFSYEVIVVDDGSSDHTTRVAAGYTKNYGADKVRVLTLIKNRGKGGAVRLGMLSARGKFLLFADADGATQFSDYEKLEMELNKLTQNNINSIVIGSRAHLEKDAIASRSLFRTFLMYGFHFLVWFFAVRTVRDTQCGFKMFTREAARCIFPVLHVERWSFDVELLYIAEKKKMLIKEIAVNWTEIEGSKLIPFWSWLQMGIDLMLIWLKYRLHIWKISDSKKVS